MNYKKTTAVLLLGSGLVGALAFLPPPPASAADHAGDLCAGTATGYEVLGSKTAITPAKWQ